MSAVDAGWRPLPSSARPCNRRWTSAAALRRIASAVQSVSGAVAAAVISLPPGQPPRIDALEGAAAAQLRGMLDQIADTIPAAPLEDPIEVRAGELVAVVIPLRAHLADRGALVAAYEAGYRPDDAEEREHLASFADQAALALDRAQALADREELAVISDRERIARDLHDLVIQRLFAAGLQLQGMRSVAVLPEVISRIDQIVDDLDLTIRDIRGTIFELQHHRSSSLRAAVRALVREYVPVLGYTPAVRTSGPVDTAVPEQVQHQLLPVLREAMSNLARHALAEHAEVDVSVGDGELVLAVSDDGTGVTEGRTESGLRNARRRATSLGGSLEVVPNEPRGTRLLWRVPLG